MAVPLSLLLMITLRTLRTVEVKTVSLSRFVFVTRLVDLGDPRVAWEAIGERLGIENTAFLERWIKDDGPRSAFGEHGESCSRGIGKEREE